MITGVRFVDLELHADPRGGIAEVFRHEWFPDTPPVVQANLSRSRAGVIRGMHVHRRQADIWVPVEGEAFVGLHDLRPASPSTGQSWTFELVAERPRAVYLPPGVAHGFCATTAFTLLYLVDRVYDGTDERGFRFDDAELAFVWPSQEPLVSDRDRASPTAADLRRELGWG